MPIKWSYKSTNACYRVVTAGNAVRLYRNGVLHSQWNPKNPLSGKLWDLFLLSAHGTQKKLSNVLVLGAGGGSVINLIHHFYPKAEIKAVDLDDMHIHVAKKYFKVNVKKCELICADAEEWLCAYQGEKFDLIIDDVFNESNNIPFRSIKSKKYWIKLLLKNLDNNGILVFNFADKFEWRQNYQLWNNSISSLNVAYAAHEMCQNRIVHMSRDDITLKKINRAYRVNRSNKYIKYINKGTITYRTIKTQFE